MTSSKSNSEEKDRSFVGSLERGLRVITAFDHDHPTLSVSEAATRVGISRAAARRFLRTLEQLGFTGCDDGQRYYLKPSVLSLGYSYLSSLRIEQIALPSLTSVMEKTGMSCSMAVLSESEIVYVARVDKPQPLRISIRVGERLPAFSTALGRVLLSGKRDDDVSSLLEKSDLRRFTDQTITDVGRLFRIIQKVRDQGWACVTNQQLSSWTSVAVPVRNTKGEIVAAINASAHNQASPEIMAKRVLPLLTVAAAEIEWTIKISDTRLIYR